MNKSESVTCKYCNKQYSSKSSLCNHVKNKHSELSVNNQLLSVVTSVNNQLLSVVKSANNQPLKVNTLSHEPSRELGVQMQNNILENVKEKYQCRYCDKKYIHVQSRWSHEKKCKIKSEELNKIKEESRIKELELLLKREQAEILRLKLKLQNSDKVDNVTLKKLNKMLLKHNNRIKNSNINTNSNVNSNNVQNNIVNNYQIVGFGREENINELLTNQEKRMILNSKLCSLEKLIEIVHCGKYNQFKNIIVTNIKDNYMYKYDEKQGVFILSNKKEVLNSLVDFRMGDLEVIYNEFLENNKIDERTKNCIENFINRINYNTDKYLNTDGVEHENYKQYKINEIKILLFNNQDKITNDISLLLSAEETE